MSKVELEKNRLDLSYQRNLQIMNTVLLIGAGSFITYLVALVSDFSKAFQYTTILVIISTLTLITYRKLDAKLKNISDEIKNLK